jgi:hypothetical protein
LFNYFEVESPDDQVYFKQTRSIKQNKDKKERKKDVGLLCTNKRCVSKITSPPRLSSRLRGARGFLLVVYFKEFLDGVAT